MTEAGKAGSVLCVLMARLPSQVCVRCNLDDTVPETTFDGEGVCAWCHRFDARAKTTYASIEERDRAFSRMVEAIKLAGKTRRYDCLMGLSGGIDSSYAVYVAKRAGLRPLVVHVDNGWNTELAVQNIERVVRGLKLDLITEVIDWEEFRGLQLSLLRAGVVDLELVSDHAIFAGLFHAARRHRLRYMLTGDNDATEAVLPKGWNHPKFDLANIRAINRAYENATMKTFPHMSTMAMILHRRLLRIERIPFLSYVDYVKEDAMALLEKELGWRRYAQKHFESVITRFYQGYILPVKFGIDKRKFHYALLIHSGQMTRAEALELLQKPSYDPALQEEDKIYVCKKFGLSVAEFDRMMLAPPASHFDWATDGARVGAAIRFNSKLRALKSRLLPRGAGL